MVWGESRGYRGAHLGGGAPGVEVNLLYMGDGDEKSEVTSHRPLTSPALSAHFEGFIRHLPCLNLTGHLAEKFPSDLQILPSNFRYREFSTIPQNSDGEIRNSDGNPSARFSIRMKKGWCLLGKTWHCRPTSFETYFR